MDEIDGRKLIEDGKFIGNSNHSKIHQFTQTDLAIELAKSLKSEVVLEVIICIDIAGKLNKFIPDISIFRHRNDALPFFIIEVDETDLQKEIQKCVLILNNSNLIIGAAIYSISEGCYYLISKQENLNQVDRINSSKELIEMINSLI
ncbi:MAG: hypothetical protein KDC13_01535 [Bacteroidetes bacterium]|nr:hypothetical protein [Bacteroidota bacterium]